MRLLVHGLWSRPLDNDDWEWLELLVLRHKPVTLQFGGPLGGLYAELVRFAANYQLGEVAVSVKKPDAVAWLRHAPASARIAKWDRDPDFPVYLAPEVKTRQMAHSYDRNRLFNHLDTWYSAKPNGAVSLKGRWT